MKRERSTRPEPVRVECHSSVESALQARLRRVVVPVLENRGDSCVRYPASWFCETTMITEGPLERNSLAWLAAGRVLQIFEQSPGTGQIEGQQAPPTSLPEQTFPEPAPRVKGS